MTTSDHAERPIKGEDQYESDATCPEYGGEIRTNASETVCADCGLVLDGQSIDTGHEQWGPPRSNDGVSVELTLWRTTELIICKMRPSETLGRRLVSRRNMSDEFDQHP